MVLLFVTASCFIYYFRDINKLRVSVEQNLKDQLQCTVKLGELNWDLSAFNIGVTTSQIALYDKAGNLVLQAGPTRFVWHVKDIIFGNYVHFYTIESADLYLNAVRAGDGTWNLITIFPPGPTPSVDNLKLNNSVVYLVDNLNQTKERTSLYKHLNLSFESKPFSDLKAINLFTRIESTTKESLIKMKGKYADKKKKSWDKNYFDFSITAKRVNLAGLQSFFANILKEPEIKNVAGEFTGRIILKKSEREKYAWLKSYTKTNNFVVEFQKDDTTQIVHIPKTDLIINALIDKNKIFLKTYRSTIDELVYDLTGYIYNWSKTLPELDLSLKTNKFNFKSVKSYIPLSLLPPDARSRIESINDNGFVEVNLKAKGPAILPKYSGTILLDDFVLTSESGFLDDIHGLSGKLVLEDEVLKIDYLNIPIQDSDLTLNGYINYIDQETSFNLNGKDLSTEILKNLIFQAGFKPDAEIKTDGKLDLNLKVLVSKNVPPEIKGKITFHDAGATTFVESENVEIKNVFGDLLLDGSEIAFHKLAGLINNEGFSLNGNLSLKEDESVNFSVFAKRLKIIKFILFYISRKTPFKPIAETVTGEASDLNLKISGTFSNPELDGKVSINNVSFSIPNLKDKISSVSGELGFEGMDLIIEELTGKIQESDIGVAGYIQDLFSDPKPNIRLVTGELEIESFWEYLKEKLQNTSFKAQANDLEKLRGIASLDLFVYPTSILGNVYFKNGEVKYKPLPFVFSSLSGRIVIGKENISLFGLTGSINNSNNFNLEATVHNYLVPSNKVEGKLVIDVDPGNILEAANPNYPDKIKTNGTIPTIVDFHVLPSLANLSFYSTFSEALQIDFPPYISKPQNEAYTVSGDVDLDLENMNIYLNQFNIKGKKLSLTTTGSIKNVNSKEPEIMLYFNTDEPSGIFMITEPIIPLMNLKMWGMIDLSGSITGTPLMFAVSTNANITGLKVPDLYSKKLTAADGSLSIYFDGEQGFLNSELQDISYVSFNAKSASISARYMKPVFYLNELKLDGNPGNILAYGLYDPGDGTVILKADGSNLELSSLGSFIFLDPEKISGMTDFSVTIDTKGKTRNEVISNTNGNLSFSITDGKLGQVALLQKGLHLANLFGQGLFGFNITNIFSLVFNYHEGIFKIIDGNVDIKDGIVKAKDFHYRAKDLFLNTFGYIDLDKSFVDLLVYGHLPGEKEAEGEHTHGPSALVTVKEKIANSKEKVVSGAVSILPEAFKKPRIVIPFLHLTPPKYFKFEMKGDLKDQKKLVRRTTRSFRWLRGKRLEKEYKFVPKD